VLSAEARGDEPVDADARNSLHEQTVPGHHFYRKAVALFELFGHALEFA
jgi:hypothetical protein